MLQYLCIFSARPLGLPMDWIRIFSFIASDSFSVDRFSKIHIFFVHLIAKAVMVQRYMRSQWLTFSSTGEPFFCFCLRKQ